MWYLSPPTRDQTWVSHDGRWIYNHWITREVPWGAFFSPVSKTSAEKRQTILFNQWIVSWLLYETGASLVAQMVKNLRAVQETQVRSLGENPLEKEMATHSSILAWRIPWTEEPGRLQSMWSPRVGHGWVTNTNFYMKQAESTIWFVMKIRPWHINS